MIENPERKTDPQALLNLYIKWQSLITTRINTKPGTHLRDQLDLVYDRTLPLIVKITDAIDEKEINRLIVLANAELKKGDNPIQNLQPSTRDRSGSHP